MTSNIVLTKNSAQVTISCNKIDDSIIKTLYPLTPPTGSAGYGTGATPGVSTTLVVDFLMMQRRFVVNGEISTNLGSTDTKSDGSTADTAKKKKDTLIYISQAGGSFTMAYEGTNYTVNFEKLIITENPTDESGEGAETVSPIVYTINFTVIEGVTF